MPPYDYERQDDEEEMGSSAAPDPKDETYAVVGAAIEVHKALGCGFTLPVYLEALEVEFKARGMSYESQVTLPIFYGEQELQTQIQAEFVVDDRIFVRVLCIPRLSFREEAEAFHQIRATDFGLGVLFNFGSHPKLEWRRYLFN